MVTFSIDDLVAKAGGRYGLVSLIQKRMRELQRGLPSLVQRKGTLLETAVEELVQNKLWLATGEEAEGLRPERHAELQARPSASPQPSPALGAGGASGKKAT